MDRPGAVRRRRTRALRARAAEAGGRPRAHARSSGTGPASCTRRHRGGLPPRPRWSARQPTTSSATGSPTASRSPRSPATWPGPWAASPTSSRPPALAHDLGHPPFGHNGERVLAELSRGRAAASRATRRPCGCSPGSRPRRSTPTAAAVGLNLTRATLDACTKYPWPRGAAGAPRRHADGSPRVVVKFGVYDDDRPVFDWLRDGVRRAARRASRRR